MIVFPRAEDNTNLINCKIDGVPRLIELGAFPPDEPTFLGKIAELWKGKRKFFYAKVKSYVGGLTYTLLELNDVSRGFGTVRGAPIRAMWLRPRSYDPPMAVGSWVIASYDRNKRCVFTGKSTDAILGEVREYHGAVVDIPTGWLLCNKANHDAGAVNGITPPNKVNRVTIGAGDAADVTPTDANDSYIGDLSIGDTGGYNQHGHDGANAVNDHGTHATHAAHADTHDHSFTVLYSALNNINLAGGGANTVIESVGPAPGTTGSDSRQHTHDAHAAHGDADNRPLWIAAGYIIFVGV